MKELLAALAHAVTVAEISYDTKAGVWTIIHKGYSKPKEHVTSDFLIETLNNQVPF